MPEFARELFRTQIIKRIYSFEKGFRQNVCLLGSDGVGKTTSVSALHQTLLALDHMLPVYVHARSDDYDNFVERWIGGLLIGLTSRHRKGKKNLNFPTLVSSLEKEYPKSIDHVRVIKRLMRKGKMASSVRELFALTATVAKESGRKIIFFVDEFHLLDQLPVTDPFGVLGKEIMVQKDTLFIVTSSSSIRAQEILNHKLALLFGNFEIIGLKPFSFDEACAFMRTLLPGIDLSVEQKKFLIRMTDGHPLSLRMILERYRFEHLLHTQSTPQGNPMHSQLLFDALTEELFSDYGKLALLFKNKIEQGKLAAKDFSLHLKALVAVASGRRKLLAIASYIGKKSKEVKKIMQRLVQAEVVIKRGSFYAVENPLFRLWLVEIYDKKMQLYTMDDSIVRDNFRVSVQSIFNTICDEEEVDITARVEELFKEFRNDVIEIDQKKVRLPQFSEIAFRPSNGRVFPLLARNPQVRWLCQITKQSVNEEDVASFLDEVKRFKKNVQRKIIITLAGIEQNAKLMAQEAKVQLWDLRNFNTLLDLYDLPKMILIPDEENNEDLMGALAQRVHSSQP